MLPALTAALGEGHTIFAALLAYTSRVPAVSDLPPDTVPTHLASLLALS